MLRPHPHVLVLLMALAAVASPLLPDHLPVGAHRPLEAGEMVTLSATRLFDSPSFSAASQFFTGERKATVLAVRSNFYQVKLEAKGEARVTQGWIYRSELELVSQASSPGGDPLPKDLARPRASRVPAADDTLGLLAPVLFAKADLLGEHQLLSGQQVLTVKVAEGTTGFLQVRTANGQVGWIHRTELPEERRRPR